VGPPPEEKRPDQALMGGNLRRPGCRNSDEGLPVNDRRGDLEFCAGRDSLADAGLVKQLQSAAYARVYQIVGPPKDLQHPVFFSPADFLNLRSS